MSFLDSYTAEAGRFIPHPLTSLKALAVFATALIKAETSSLSGAEGNLSPIHANTCRHVSKIHASMFPKYMQACISSTILHVSENMQACIVGTCQMVSSAHAVWFLEHMPDATMRRCRKATAPPVCREQTPELPQWCSGSGRPPPCAPSPASPRHRSRSAAAGSAP